MRLRWLTLVSLCLFGTQAIGATPETIKPARSLPKTTPWDLAALSKPPKFQWIDGGKGAIRSLRYRGLAYKGKPTSVFAYYATPGTLAGDTSTDKNPPLILR